MLKEILEMHFGLGMRFSSSKNKNCLDSVLITYKDSEVSHVIHEHPKVLLSCIIGTLSDSYIDIYENQYHGIYAYFSEVPIDPGLHYVRTIHIPMFRTAKELKMKLELSA